ncbi:glucosamine-6-phosphate deaminase [Dysgonomonas sp. 511]|uniref:glucosamine-6-phosphate deaminase n=1 Tax=Dysgonomonas sp. 511 TaxID=2302930 RepID=UPI0013D36BA7|nr:glucosamine-6-phosphate deaminase [Dysgonomonas sp. 511]NDV78196.1 glucosamine-6-phosphate deaminase [Dysgonomonas sp. 511]
MATEIMKGRLKVKISDSRAELGELAAKEIAGYIMELQGRKDEINIIFASAPSQNEFLANLLKYDIDWGKVNAFHMDEYIGIDSEAPQAFGKFLKDRVFSKVKCKSVHYMDSMAADPQAECERYAALLKQMPVDMVFLGIGENGHLAFNDPHVAFFDDPLAVKIVDLSPECRAQQINDGCFETLDQVPTHAITITIPELLHIDKLYAIVPTKAKANAIKGTCDGSISPLCPASILRTHKDVTLYVDVDSASLVDM